MLSVSYQQWCQLSLPPSLSGSSLSMLGEAPLGLVAVPLTAVAVAVAVVTVAVVGTVKAEETAEDQGVLPQLAPLVPFSQSQTPSSDTLLFVCIGAGLLLDMRWRWWWWCILCGHARIAVTFLHPSPPPSSAPAWLAKYGPPTRTEYRITVENISSRVSWQVSRLASVGHAFCVRCVAELMH